MSNLSTTEKRLVLVDILEKWLELRERDSIALDPGEQIFKKMLPILRRADIPPEFDMQFYGYALEHLASSLRCEAADNEILQAYLKLPFTPEEFKEINLRAMERMQETVHKLLAEESSAQS